MKKYFCFLCFLMLLTSSCTPAGPLSDAKVLTTEINHTSYDVQKIRQKKNGWAANPSNIWGGFIDPEIYIFNIKAIEKVSGCKVLRDTIINQGLNTMAAVSCK